VNGVDGSTGTRALGDTLTALLDAPGRLATGLASALAQRRSPGCEIPPPCCEPRPAGTCCLEIPPGCKGTLRLHVSNCNWSRQVVAITAMGKLAGWMTFQPTTQMINPQEQATFVVTVQVPNGEKPGQTVSGPLLVRGCLDHFVRVEVRVVECAGRTCCDIAVEDCQDQVHHWYDHFYCPRPCRTLPSRDPNDG
jgi:hypothetical protein